MSSAIANFRHFLMENTQDFRKEFKKGMKNFFGENTPGASVVIFGTIVFVFVFVILLDISSSSSTGKRKLAAGIEHAWALTRQENNPAAAAKYLVDQIAQASLTSVLAPIEIDRKNDTLLGHISGLSKDDYKRLDSAILYSIKPDEKTHASVNQVNIGKQSEAERAAKRPRVEDLTEYFSWWQFRNACRLESNRIDVKIEAYAALAK